MVGSTLFDLMTGFHGEKAGITGVESYKIEGIGISVAWKVSQPQVAVKSGPSNKTVVYLPGWGFNEQARAIEPFCQNLADYSQSTTYALDTRAECVIPHSLFSEAQADCQFIEEKGIHNIIVVGHSQGGTQAIYLTKLLQSKIHVNGLILVDTVGLHTQPLGELLKNYVQELIRTLKIDYSLVSSDDILNRKQNQKYGQEGMTEAVRQIRLDGGIHHYLKRVWNELAEINALNPSAQEIRVPVVIVHGANDCISQPSKIIPCQKGTRGSSYIQNIHERERFLQEHFFSKSPSVKMLVVKKMGYHGLPGLRPDEVARSSLYLLERSCRTKNRLQDIPPQIDSGLCTFET